MYNIFLDDYRSPMCLNDTREWTVVRNYKEFVKTITEKGLPKYISFDHDLSAEHYDQELNEYGFEIDYSRFKEKTGYDAAKWLVNYCMEKKLLVPEYQVHSMNPVGKENIISLLENFRLYQKENGIIPN